MERVRDDEYIGAEHGGANKNDEPFRRSERKEINGEHRRLKISELVKAPASKLLETVERGYRGVKKSDATR